MHLLAALIFIELPRAVSRRRGIVLLTVLALGFWTSVLSQLWQPAPHYTAYTRLKIDAEHPGRAVATIASFPVLKRVATQIDLFALDHTAADTAMTVLGLQTWTEAYLKGKSDIAIIAVTHISPLMARDLANAICNWKANCEICKDGRCA